MYVIEAKLHSEDWGYIKEKKNEFYLVPKLEDATVYETEKEAEVAKVYIKDHHYPKIVKIGE